MNYKEPAVMWSSTTATEFHLQIRALATLTYFKAIITCLLFICRCFGIIVKAFKYVIGKVCDLNWPGLF